MMSALQFWTFLIVGTLMSTVFVLESRNNDKSKRRPQEDNSEDVSSLDSLILSHWLSQNHWAHLAPKLNSLDIKSLADLKSAKLSEDNELKEAQDYLPDPEDLPQLELLIRDQLLSQNESTHNSNKNHNLRPWIGIILCGFLAYFVWQIGLTPYDVLHGIPVHKLVTKVKIPENLSVSNSKTVRVEFFNFQGSPIEIINNDFSCDIHVDNGFFQNSSSRWIRGNVDAHDNVLDLVFPSRICGTYTIFLKTLGRDVRGFPYTLHLAPGSVSASKTSLVSYTSTVVLTPGQPHTFFIKPKDDFGNCISDGISSLVPDLQVELKELQKSKKKKEFLAYHSLSKPFVLCASVAFDEGEEGWYVASISFGGQPIATPEVTLLVLSHEDNDKVKKLTKDNKYVEMTLTEIGKDGVKVNKNVFCYLTTKQLTIKEYYFKVIPVKLYSFRLNRATSIRFKKYHHQEDTPIPVPVLIIDDGCQSRLELRSKEGNILAAAFYSILLDKIGGSESFNEKRNYFFNKLWTYHQNSKNHRHTSLSLTVNRTSVMESTYAATRWFSESDWCRLFIIEFEGEKGLDEGGLRREWFQILTQEIFHPKRKLFVTMEPNSGAVYPNPNAKSLKWFKFAGKIVGKSIYESAQGSTYRQHLPIRFSRSFLAQIIGLRVHYKHFASDSPEFYASKINFIENNSVEGLDLTFSEEDYEDEEGKSFIKSVDLKPKGSKIRVTDSNKAEYLDLLAQYRLSIKIKAQVSQFLVGLNQFVPDSMLSMFDESELELLLCGVREYDLEDLKRNHHVIWWDGLSQKTVLWFWMSLATFSSEQLSRLLQFTTGSSQLPPGGFSELKPQFQISSLSSRGSLPTAHTCFNMICLPDHDSYEQFERALITAITEGYVGFENA